MTTSTTTFYIPIPLWNNIESKLNINIKLFNMWEGQVETTFDGINDEPVTIMGIWEICGDYEGFGFPLCFPICMNENMSNAIESMWSNMDDGEEVAIVGISSCIDAVYVIKNFEIKSIPRTVEGYAYRFDLEKVREN